MRIDDISLYCACQINIIKQTDDVYISNEFHIILCKFYEYQEIFDGFLIVMPYQDYIDTCLVILKTTYIFFIKDMHAAYND